MRIIILSDLHIADNGLPIWETDTTAHFNKAINLIKQIPSIDAIIVSGDIADKGTPWAYNYVRNALDALRIPTYLVPGNHDNISNFYKLMNSRWCHTCKDVTIQDWKFIFLSTVKPDSTDENSNMSRGYLSDSEMYRFRESVNSDEKNCVILHHPPIEQEGWLNRKLLENRLEFNEIVKSYSNIRLVVYGHTHFHSINNENDVTYIGSPAVGFAFNKDLPKFQIDNGAEAILILELNNDRINCKSVMING